MTTATTNDSPTALRAPRLRSVWPRSFPSLGDGMRQGRAAGEGAAGAPGAEPSSHSATAKVFGGGLVSQSSAFAELALRRMA